MTITCNRERNEYNQYIDVPDFKQKFTKDIPLILGKAVTVNKLKKSILLKDCFQRMILYVSTESSPGCSCNEC